MRRTTSGLLSLTLATGLGVSIGAPVQGAPAAPSGAPSAPSAATTANQSGHSKHSDELTTPLEEKQRALKEKALKQVIAGTATPFKSGRSTVVKVNSGKSGATKKGTELQMAPGAAATTQTWHKDEYVELSREGTDKIFVVLAEFGNERHPDFPDQDTDPSTPGPVVFDGPMHNSIPEPDRTQDNSTFWRKSFDRSYFQNLYFGTGGEPGAGYIHETVRQYYERQSSGRYSIDGMVTPWVKVKYNEARYGRSGGYPCGGHVCSNVWNLIDDAVTIWMKRELASGKTAAQVKADLAQYDVWDRFDADGDGNFNEPDGYIDHFQIVHAGGDEADGDPWQGEDAIWSHKWYDQTTPIGAGGPNGMGGFEIPGTGMWVGAYTMQPENGGMDVFVHEYGHDLGLPDLYDTTTGADNGVNWWSIMAQSRVSGPRDLSIQGRAADFGVWEKLQLGWLNYTVVNPTKTQQAVYLGPSEYNSAKPQAAIVPLPDKVRSTELVEPYAGSKSWWSGAGDDLNNTLTRAVTLGAGAASLKFMANWDIEDCGPDACDYAYVEVDDGSGFKPIAGNITTAAEGNGIDGTSNGWVQATFDLSAYAGKTIGLRFRYYTDGAVGGKGFFADDVTVTSGGTTVFTSGAESGAEGWTAAGFSAVGASISKAYKHYYMAAHRAYVSFDRYLQSGPYNFGWLNSRPDWTENFPYQNGLLISYWDTSMADNNTGEHPGEGQILPIDAHPEPIIRTDGGGYMRARIAGYDATFSNEQVDPLALHFNGVVNKVPSRPGNNIFRDEGKYWYEATPYTGVKTPATGTRIRVDGAQGTTMKVVFYTK